MSGAKRGDNSREQTGSNAKQKDNLPQGAISWPHGEGTNIKSTPPRKNAGGVILFASQRVEHGQNRAKQSEESENIERVLIKTTFQGKTWRYSQWHTESKPKGRRAQQEKHDICKQKLARIGSRRVCQAPLA